MQNRHDQDREAGEGALELLQIAEFQAPGQGDRPDGEVDDAGGDHQHADAQQEQVNGADQGKHMQQWPASPNPGWHPAGGSALVASIHATAWRHPYPDDVSLR